MFRLAIGALLVVAGSFAPLEAQERFTLRGDQVAIHNLVGELAVVGGSGRDVRVEVTRGGAHAARLSVEERSIDGWPTLIVNYPDDNIVYPREGSRSRSQFSVDKNGTFGNSLLRLTLDDGAFTGSRDGYRGARDIRVVSSGRGLEAWADLRIEVPEGKTIAVHLGTGHISVSNVNGHVRLRVMSAGIAANGVNGSAWLETGSGSIRAENISGPASIRTGSGGVTVAAMNSARLEVSTGSGSIRGSELTATRMALTTGSGGVRLAAVRADALRAITGSGGISIGAISARNVELRTGSGSISGALLTDVHNASFQTGSGGITLTVPEQIGAELRISTVSGGISTNIPMQLLEQRRSFVHGRLGDGSGQIQISTGSGSVRIRKAG